MSFYVRCALFVIQFTTVHCRVTGDTVGPVIGDTVGPITGDTAYVIGDTAYVTGNTVSPVNSDVVVMSHCMLFIIQGAGEGERACRAVAETGSTAHEEISHMYTLALLHIRNQHR